MEIFVTIITILQILTRSDEDKEDSQIPKLALKNIPVSMKYF